MQTQSATHQAILNTMAQAGYRHSVSDSEWTFTKDDECTLVIAVTGQPDKAWVTVSVPILHVSTEGFPLLLKGVLMGQHSMTHHMPTPPFTTFNDTTGDVEVIVKLAEGFVQSKEFSYFVEDLAHQMKLMCLELISNSHQIEMMTQAVREH